MLSFEDTKVYAESIKAAYGDRDTIFEGMEDIFLMENAELPTADWIKETIDSTGRDKLLGAVRLLTAADPVWSVPREKNSDEIDQELASDVEKAASMMWTASGRIKKTPVHYLAVLSGLLYGQADIAVTRTADLVGRAATPAQKKRMEKIAARTPLMFESLNPKICYPVFDGYGLAAHYSVREMLVADVRARWGDKVLDGKKGTDVVDYSEYWDLEKHAVWVEGEDTPLLDEAHDLPVIPIASARMEGSELFDDEFKWQPFLYTMYKASSYKRASLLQTVMYTNLFTIGSNPQLVHQKSRPDSTLTTNFDQIGGVLEVPQGDSVQQLNLTAVTPEMQQMYDLLERKIETSTIYAQTLGEPLGANAPYSMVHLLSQAGRLPLVPYQRMLSNVITDAMQVGLEMLRAGKGTKVTAKGGNKGIELDFTKIPEDLELQATLDISMPQDRAQNAKTAIELSNSGMISLERAREDFLAIGQSDDEQTVIWSEQMANNQFQIKLQMQMEQMKMQMQQMMQQQPPQGMPQGMPPQGGQMPPQGMPPGMGQPPMQGEQIPPELLQQGAATDGLPLTEGLPPQGTNPDQMMPPGMGGM